MECDDHDQHHTKYYLYRLLQNELPELIEVAVAVKVFHFSDVKVSRFWDQWLFFDSGLNLYILVIT